jgi:hypothetical protein
MIQKLIERQIQDESIFAMDSISKNKYPVKKSYSSQIIKKDNPVNNIVNVKLKNKKRKFLIDAQDNAKFE